MTVSSWRVFEPTADSLLEHLCIIRHLPFAHLEPNYTTDLHDPFLLPDMKEAVAIIKIAQKKGQKVTIFGDYDADGTPAAALLSLTFDRIRLDHEVILPDRQSGYGLKAEIVAEAAKNSQVLITVDNGTAAVTEISEAKAKGLTVIVIDHHLPGEIIPPADAIINPYLSTAKYPFLPLCGCALAYKFVTALATEFPDLTESFQKWLLDLVAISTVADMMPIVGENRALVHFGLRVLDHRRRPGLRALLEQAGFGDKPLLASELGYIIGPRLNAGGRLTDNKLALRLLRTEDESEALAAAVELERVNRRRQELVESATKEADGLLWQQNKADDSILAVLGDWPSGIVGLIAGKLAGQNRRPALVATTEMGVLRASGRSVNGYNLVDGLRRVSSHLESFGGHDQAAGLSIRADRWSKFVADIKRDAVDNIAPIKTELTLTADAELEEGQLTLDQGNQLRSLEPYGIGNHAPLFLIRNCQVSQTKAVGAKASHLKMTVRCGQTPLEVIGFNIYPRFNRDRLQTIHLAGYLEINSWQNRQSLQLRLVDYAPAEAMIEKIRYEEKKPVPVP